MNHADRNRPVLLAVSGQGLAWSQPTEDQLLRSPVSLWRQRGENRILEGHRTRNPDSPFVPADGAGGAVGGGEVIGGGEKDLCAADAGRDGDYVE